MTLDELENTLREIADRDGNYLDKRMDAKDALLDYVLASIPDEARQKGLRALYEDAAD